MWLNPGLGLGVVGVADQDPWSRKRMVNKVNPCLFDIFGQCGVKQFFRGTGDRWERNGCIGSERHGESELFHPDGTVTKAEGKWNQMAYHELI